MSFRNKFVISKEDRIIRFLSLYKEQIEELYFQDLQNKAGEIGIPRGGSFIHTLIDVIAMGLLSKIINGTKRYRITELGRRLRHNKNDRNIWKQAYLNVEIYKQYYAEFPEKKDIEHFKKWIYEKYSLNDKTFSNTEKLLGMGIRRYFEGIYLMDIPTKKGRKKQKIKIDLSSI